MATTRLVNSPVFYQVRDFFTGDNVHHYLPAKYLWTVCNVTKTGFYQPVYDFRLDGPVVIDFMFYPEQPQHKYFKKPAWINEFVVAKDVATAQQMVGNYDGFINNYRFRGADELNWGCPSSAPAIELYLTAYTYKAVREEGLYLDDLLLADEYAGYLQEIKARVNPEGRPVIALHHRGSDRWKRHLPNAGWLSEVLLHNLVSLYPDHQIVLMGEGWRWHRHPRVRCLESYLNLGGLKRRFKDYSACLQFVLAAYFCRDADLVLGGLSGFTHFIEMIRPLDRTPPIPLFWSPGLFLGDFPTWSLPPKWKCQEHDDYLAAHPDDQAFQHHWNYFLYFVRNEALLKPYCLDDPNSVDKVCALLSAVSGVKVGITSMRPMPQDAVETLVSCAWKLKPFIGFVRRIWQILFVEHTVLAHLRFVIKNLA